MMIGEEKPSRLSERTIFRHEMRLLPVSSFLSLSLSRPLFLRSSLGGPLARASGLASLMFFIKLTLAARESTRSSPLRGGVFA